MSYGWYALGVYLLLSALDFGIAFVGINLLSAKYISRVAASAKSMATSLISKQLMLWSLAAGREPNKHKLCQTGFLGDQHRDAA